MTGEPSEHQPGEGTAGDSESRPADDNPSAEAPASDLADAEAATGGPIVPGHRPFGKRVLGTLRCEPGVFEEIAADPGATRQALAVVAVELLVTTAAQAAVIDWNSWQTLPMLLLFPISGFAAWPISAAICSVMSRWFSADSPRFPCWLRTVGFVQAPGALGTIPVAGSVVGGFYCLVLQVVAVRRLAGVSTGIAIFVSLIAFLGPILFAALMYAFVLSFIALFAGVLNLPF